MSFIFRYYRYLETLKFEKKRRQSHVLINNSDILHIILKILFRYSRPLKQLYIQSLAN